LSDIYNLILILILLIAIITTITVITIIHAIINIIAIKNSRAVTCSHHAATAAVKLRQANATLDEIAVAKHKQAHISFTMFH